jgi:hypothetical protein
MWDNLVRLYKLCKVSGTWLIENICEMRYLDKDPNVIEHLDKDKVGWTMPIPQQLTTTPPAINVENSYPFLRGMGKETVRLHPRPSSLLDPLCSKIGGSFAWPTEEEFPVCPYHKCGAIPVLQSRKSDFPQFPFFPSTDLFQMLWYPQDYSERRLARQVLLFWRNSSKLTRMHLL